MTDLEINIALARAMRWVNHSHIVRFLDLPNGSFVVVQGNVFCKNAEFLPYSKSFDYRDPVIFTAICKHWSLVANFEGFVSGTAGIDLIGTWQRDCIEKAAALTVIELAKRGIK